MPLNDSMLNDLSSLLREAIQASYSIDLAREFLSRNNIYPKRLVGKQTVYVSTVIHQLIHHQALSVTDQILDNRPPIESNLLLETGGFPLQQWVALMAAHQWLTYADERGYLYFEPTCEVQVAWLQLLYERSFQACRCSNCEVDASRTLLLQQHYSVSELSWWYVGDRCQQLGQQLGGEVVADPEILLGLIENDSELVQFLLGAVVDVWDALATNGSRRRTAVGRQLVECFLAWERSRPIAILDVEQTLVLLAVLRLTVIEMLGRSTDR
jgi:hypothetical protein